MQPCLADAHPRAAASPAARGLPERLPHQTGLDLLAGTVMKPEAAVKRSCWQAGGMRTPVPEQQGKRGRLLRCRRAVMQRVVARHARKWQTNAVNEQGKSLGARITER